MPDTQKDPRNPFDYPLNPEFGQGIYRRRIRLSQAEGCVVGGSVKGELEDCNHGFSVEVFHNGDIVTDITAQHHRIPFTTCSGANDPLKNLIGLSLKLTAQELSNEVNARANCTHWLDLTMLAIQHALRKETVRDYLIEVPDEAEKPSPAKVFCNGILMHTWLMQDWFIQAPSELAGKTIYKGFSAWANAAFEHPDKREAAFMLQKGYFVSRARRFDVNSLAGKLATQDSMMHGACYSYSEPQLSKAIRTENTVKDFTHTAEELLLFK